MNEELEYSWSGGQYWSQYNHCRVWENGTYELMIRDRYGQTSTTNYEVTNNHKVNLGIPVITTDYIENTWDSVPKNITITAGTNATKIKYSNNGINWTTTNSPYVIYTGGLVDTNTVYLKSTDGYGNESLPITFIYKRDTTAPTNINFVPTVSMANEIYTTVSAVEDKALPLKYSITYDGGQTWSIPQIGRKFGLVNNPPKGTYMVNCRAYNAEGLYVEGTPVQVTIS